MTNVTPRQLPYTDVFLTAERHHVQHSAIHREHTEEVHSMVQV